MTCIKIRSHLVLSSNIYFIPDYFSTNELILGTVLIGQAVCREQNDYNIWFHTQARNAAHH